MYAGGKALALFAAVLVVWASIGPAHAPAYAKDPPGYSETCNASETISASLATQRKQYCDAAKSAQKAADTDAALWKVWAGVAAVCTAACAASLAQYYSKQYVCMGTNVAAGVTDAAMSKNFTGALMAILTSGAGYMINRSMNEDGKGEAKKVEAPKKPVEKDISACLTAGTAAIQGFTKNKSMKGQEETAKKNIELAKQLTDTDSEAVADSSSPSLSGSTSTGKATAGGSAGTYVSSSGAVESSSDNVSTEACSSASNGGNELAVIQCAVGADSNVPSFVANRKFLDEFKDDTGLSFPDFIAKDDSPANVMGQALGASVGPDGSVKLAQLLSAVEQSMLTEVPSSTYASSGGGGGSKSEGDSSFNNLLSGFVNQLNPKKGGEGGANPGVSAVAFANRHRSPAAIPDDPTLSIFDRVSYRYIALRLRLLSGM